MSLPEALRPSGTVSEAHLRTFVIRSLTAAAILLAAQAAQAQTCYGNAPIDRQHPLIAGAALDLSSGQSTITGIFGGGTDQFFVTGAVGRSSVDGFDGGGTNIGATAGAQLKISSTKKISLCPALTVGRSSGLTDDFFGVDYSSTRISPSVTMGIVAATRGTTDIVPSVSLTFEHYGNKADDGVEEYTDSTNFANLGLGTGFVFKQKFAVQPIAYIPIGLESGNVTFELLGTYSFGK